MRDDVPVGVRYAEKYPASLMNSSRLEVRSARDPDNISSLRRNSYDPRMVRERLGDRPSSIPPSRQVEVGRVLSIVEGIEWYSRSVVRSGDIVRTSAIVKARTFPVIRRRLRSIGVGRHRGDGKTQVPEEKVQEMRREFEEVCSVRQTPVCEVKPTNKQLLTQQFNGCGRETQLGDGNQLEDQPPVRSRTSTESSRKRTPFIPRIAKFENQGFSETQTGSVQWIRRPKSYLAAFLIAAGRVELDEADEDAGYCKLFSENLCGQALMWFTQLEPGSINNFDELSAVFLKQYSILMDKSVSDADLWNLTQGPTSHLELSSPSSRGAIKTPKNLAAVSFICPTKRLWHDSRFKEDLILHKPDTIQDALFRANNWMEVEDEKRVLRKEQTSKTSVTFPTKKFEPRENQGPKKFGSQPLNNRRETISRKRKVEHLGP
ncbi:Retrotransposon gag domain [Arabidopsis thaliana x Arabidopsis arenosa]|uniref:Retrotransposon gag domain n=1 Tax=Arabidopsis thaliana x Arabidopsis arenosa TaxID=1240361 RepID=A0A8T1YC43_9BRAS|nr:Retrotransposon gag domain [Arabidopsis thaliana x Arabidopsis arenosa]